jgi:hypothetical protein
MLGQMLTNISNLAQGLPGFIVLSYERDRDLPWWPLIFLVPGFCWALWYRGTTRELLFWPLFFASIISSAAIVFADDGWRVFYVTWPYVALFVSLGFASPGVLRIPSQWSMPVSLRGGTAFVVLLVSLIMIAPATTRALYGPGLTALAAAKMAPREAILVGRTLTGFAILPDDAPFPKIIPAMHASDFRRIAARIGIERDFGNFVDAAIQHVPFAFVTAARMDQLGSEQLFIAPVQILSEPRATAWKVTFGQDIRPPLIYEISSYRRLQ